MTIGSVWCCLVDGEQVSFFLLYCFLYDFESVPIRMIFVLRFYILIELICASLSCTDGFFPTECQQYWTSMRDIILRAPTYQHIQPASTTTTTTIFYLTYTACLVALKANTYTIVKCILGSHCQRHSSTFHDIFISERIFLTYIILREYDLFVCFLANLYILYIQLKVWSI